MGGQPTCCVAEDTVQLENIPAPGTNEVLSSRAKQDVGQDGRWFAGEWRTNQGLTYSITEVGGVLRYVEDHLPKQRLTGDFKPQGEWWEATITNQIDGEKFGQLRIKREGDRIHSSFKPQAAAEFCAKGLVADRI
mmetsp:Transcript_71024/g.205916  ORF Transcript_71024/g.205916 Transcript_71024/m.205916 type:complete len:135 (-) Transcript_71024:13-417(-)